MQGEEGFQGALDLFPNGYSVKNVEPQLSGKKTPERASSWVMR